MIYEEYKLVLTHYIVDEKGGKVPLDEPITVRQVFQRTDKMPSTVLVNRMLDEMGRYLLRFLNEQEKTE